MSSTVNTRSRTLFKNNAAEPPPKDSQINNEDCGVAQIPSRSNHFAIYTEEDDQDENCMPTPQGCAIRPDKPKVLKFIFYEELQAVSHLFSKINSDQIVGSYFFKKRYTSDEKTQW